MFEKSQKTQYFVLKIKAKKSLKKIKKTLKNAEKMLDLKKTLCYYM